jgi:hypothetical protein
MPAERRQATEAKAADLLEDIKAGKVRMSLGDLRGTRDVTQEKVAAALRIKQAGVSRIEARTDMHVSTLARYVAALGGRLEVRAVFPEGPVIVDGLTIAGTPAAGGRKRPKRVGTIAARRRSIG